MGLFDLFTKPRMDDGVAEFLSTSGAALLDVRTEEEYAEGHIDGSVNIPLNKINAVLNKYPNKKTPLFVHCRSGARSGQAVAYLQQMGYTNVKNIGGIINYHGKEVH